MPFNPVPAYQLPFGGMKLLKELVRDMTNEARSLRQFTTAETGIGPQPPENGKIES